MNQKVFQTRITLKHDLTEKWNSCSFVGLAGEVVIYDDRYTITDENGKVITVPGIKICDGETDIKELPFIDYPQDQTADCKIVWQTLGEGD